MKEITVRNREIEKALERLAPIRSERYMRSVRKTVSRYLRWADGRPEESLVDRLELYAAFLLSGGISPRSIRAYVGHLKLVLRTIAKMGGNTDVISRTSLLLDAVELPKADAGRRVLTWLSADEMRELLASPDRSTPMGRRDFTVLVTLAMCGLRRGEVAGMKWSDFTKRDGMTVLSVSHKKRSRVVPIDDSVWSVLLDYKKEAKNGDGRVFSIAPQTVHDIVGRYHSELTPHDIRRSMARECWKNDMNILDLSIVLGHADISTTQKYIGCEQNPLRQNPAQFLRYTDILGGGNDG